MRIRILVLSCLLLTCAAQELPAQTIPLSVREGFQLQVIVTEKVRFKTNAPVKGRIVDPVFAFDREVIPPGAEILGRVTGFQKAPKWKRTLALANGNLTPLREPVIDFDTLVFPDGRNVAIQTLVGPGTDTVVRFDNKRAEANKGHLATGAARARAEIQARKRKVIEAVKGPGKMERLKQALWGLAPYRPQFVPAGGRFKATLQKALEFPSTTLEPSDTNLIGTMPPPGVVISARLATEPDSSMTSRGATVEAVLSQPVFSEDSHLIFPEGSRLVGTVVQVRPARRWHRNGQLAFMFSRIQPPVSVTPNAQTAQEIDGRLESVEVEAEKLPNARLDEEGGVQVAQSKTRFIAPAVALVMVSRAGDDGEHDDIENGTMTGVYRNNYAARAVGGGIGFGLLGSALGRLSRPFGVGLGLYGAARSVYLNILARGQEVTFPVDTPVEVRLGALGDTPGE